MLQVMNKTPFSSETNSFIKCLRDSLPDALGGETQSMPYSDAINAVLRAGKKLRPGLLYLFGKLSYLQDELVLPVAQSLEIYHTATLLLDDIQDCSFQRRGLPCFHEVHGVPLGVAAAALLRSNMYRPISQSQAIPKPIKFEIYSEFNEAVAELCLGQYSELSWRINSKFEATESDYIEMVKKKTGSLFQLACTTPSKLQQTVTSRTELLAKFGHLLGVAFQIRDDLLSIDLTADGIGKDLFADIQESKQTLMVIHALGCGNKLSNKLKLILQKDTKCDTDASDYMDILYSSGSVEYGKMRLEHYLQESTRVFQNYLTTCANPNHEAAAEIYSVVNHFGARTH